MVLIILKESIIFIFGSSLCSDWGRCWRFNNIQTCVLIEKTQNWRNMYNQLNKYKHRIHSGCHRGHLVLEKDHFKNIWREKLRPRFLNYGEKKAGVSHSSMTSFKCFKQMLGNIFPFRKIRERSWPKRQWLSLPVQNFPQSTGMARTIWNQRKITISSCGQPHCTVLSSKRYGIPQ